jgi:hypothetical protein
VGRILLQRQGCGPSSGILLRRAASSRGRAAWEVEVDDMALHVPRPVSVRILLLRRGCILSSGSCSSMCMCFGSWDPALWEGAPIATQLRSLSALGRLPYDNEARWPGGDPTARLGGVGITRRLHNGCNAWIVACSVGASTPLHS